VPGDREAAAVSEIAVFDFRGYNVRVVMIDGEPWWVVNDVCAVLEIVQTRNAVDRLPEGDVRLADVTDSLGRRQSTNVVNEPGLYELIIRSDKPAAREFRRWVTAEVLPQIRQTGSYAPQLTPAEVLLAQAQRLVEQERQVRQLNADLAEVSARVDGIEQRTGWFTALAFSRLNGCPTDHRSLVRLGIAAGRVARDAGIQPTKVVNEAFGEVNSYPEWVLVEAAEKLA
jgi:prophage antirepressor-like protein